MKNGRKVSKRSLWLAIAVIAAVIFGIWSAFGESGKSTLYSNPVTLDLSGLNSAPVITEGATASLDFVEDGSAQTLTLTATDDDGDTLTWSISSAPGLGTASVDGSGVVTYQPNADENGDDTFTVTVSDGNGGTDSIVISVAITAVNDAPILPPCTDVSVDEDCGAQSIPNWAGATAGPSNESTQVLTFHITDNTNPALFADGGEPAVAADGTLTFMPAPETSGTATLTLYVTDDALGTDTSATRTFTITVLTVNDPPINTVPPTLSGTLEVGSTITATHGTWVDFLDGGLGTYTYATSWQSATDDIGTDPATLGIADSYTLTAAEGHRYVRAVVTITDTDASGIVSEQAFTDWSLVGNSDPAITEKTATIATDEDTAGTVTLHATDRDGDTLTWSVSTPAKGSAAVADGVITYTPDADENGADTFTVTVSDSYGGSANLDVAVTIAAVNDQPTFTVGDDVNVSEDCGAQSIANWVKAMSAGAANENDQTLTFTVTANTNAALFATGGMPEVSSSGTLTFTPAADVHGVATITLQLADNGGGADTSATQTFTITVSAVNDAPVNTVLPSVSGTYTVAGALTATSGTWNDDTDGNLGTLTYAWQWQSATDATGTGLQTLGTGDSYTLTSAESHRYVRALVTVTDTDVSGSATAHAASVWTLVDNTKPVIAETEASITTNEDTAKAITLHASDADADTLTWSASTPAKGVASVVGGVVTYTPGANENGSDTFTVTVSDGYGGTASLDVTVTIASVNDTPSFTVGENQTVAEDCGAQTVENWIKAMSAGPADEASQTLTFSIVNNTNAALFAADGAPAISQNGTLTYKPATDANGVATLTVQVADNGGGADTSATQTFTITVTPVNDVPSFTKGADQSVNEDCGAVTVAGWVVAKSAGPDDESAQTLTFHTSNDNTALFTAGGQPTVAADGTLTYTPAPNANGDATVTLYVADNGGTAHAGDVDTSATQTFTIHVAPVNDLPSFTVGANQTVAEDCGTQTVVDWIAAKSAGPANEAAQTLTFTVVDNSNPALFAAGGAPAISPEGTLTYTPAPDANGTATLTLNVADSGDGTNTSATQTFTITVTPVNDVPVITGDAAFTTNEDTPYGYTFTVTDVEDAASALTLAYDTGNTALLKKANMALTGSGSNRTLTVTPEPDRSGTVNITLTATDTTGATVTKTIAMTVTPVNDAPTISTITNRATDEDTSTGPIGFTIGDLDTDVATCTVTAVSDNEALIANTAAGIVVGGSGTSRTVTLNPSLNQTGTAHITVTVSDGSLSSQTTFTLTVNPVNDAPTLTAIDDVTIDEDTVTAPIRFTVSDVDSPIADLTVSAATNNTAMIPRANIVLSSIAADGTCTLTLTPVANSYGTANMSVTVKDAGGKLSTGTFVLTVLPVNDLPVLSAISNQSTDEDSAKTINVTVSDIDNTTAQLTLTATASTNTALVPLSAITIPAGTGSSRSVTMTPVADQYGTTDITLTLTDGSGGTVTRTFTLTVNSVNDKPTFTSGGNVAVDEDCGSFTVSGWATGISTGAANENQTLVFSVSTDNNSLFTTLPAIDATTGNLTFTPAPNACGVVNITATLSDSGGATSATASFTITIRPINDAPVAQSMGSGLSTDEDQQVSGNLRATDVDADPLTYELVSGTSHGVTSLTTAHGKITINPATGTFVYVPNKDYFDGTDTFYYRAFDGKLYSNDAPVNIDFTGINDPPVAVDGAVSIPEDKADFTDTLASLVSDVDNINLTYAVVTNPDNGGTLVLNTADGTYSYRPAADFNGIEHFTFRAYDGSLYSNTATVTVTVTPVNDAPLPKSETVSIDEGQTLNGMFKATDVEQDAIVYSVATSPVPDGFVFTDSATGAFKYTPAIMPSTTGRTVTVDFTAVDAKGASSTGTITINVRSVNLPPVRADGSPAVYVATEDIPMNGNLNVTDPNGDALVYTILSPVRNGTLSAIDANGNFTYTSASNFNGTDRFTFMATDPKGLRSSIYTAQISVTGVNDKPEAYDQYYYTNKNVAVSGITPVGYDADGNGLTFSVATAPAHGTVVQNANGTFTYTPATDYSGNDTFTYTANDGHGGVSDPATVHIHVYGDGGSGGGSWFDGIPNQTIPENTSVTVPISVTNMTIASVSATSSNQWLLDSGDITVNNNSGSYSLTLTPNAYRTGQTVMTVTVKDTSNNTYVRTFILTVTRVNYAPTANDLTRTMDENTEMFEFVTGHDYNGDALTFTLATSPTHGTLDFDSSGTFHYKPNTNYSGTDTFTYTIKDSEATSAPATVTINITQVPVAPAAANGSFTTDEDTSYSGQLVGTEPHGGALIYHLEQNGHLGTATVDADGKFTYVPKANESGTDAFTFKTEGPTGLFSAVARISITIVPVNDVPVIVYKTFTTSEDQTLSGYLEATDADVGDTLTYEVVPAEGMLTMGTLTLDSKTGHFTYTPNSNMNGTDHFRVLVRDASSSSPPMEFNVTISPVNDAPVAVDVPITVDEDSSVTGSLTPFYTDVDGDAQTFTVMQSPTKGSIVFNSDGTYTYTPNKNANGTDYFTFRTKDSGGLSSNVALATVTINPVNDVPTLDANGTWSINEDSHEQVFYFTVGDVEDSASDLTVSGAWNTAEIASVTFWGTGSSRWMKVTPVDSFQSDTDITITVKDTGKDGTLTGDVKSASKTVHVTVVPVNDTPTINGKGSNGSAITTAVTIDEDTSTSAIGFTIGDEESLASSLVITGGSSNTTLVPVSGIHFGGSGTDRTVTVTPAPDQNGSVRITVYVSDGNSTRNAYVDVTVRPVNDAPIVKPPVDQTIPEDSSTEILYYTISDIDSAVTAITMSATSSNPSIVAVSGITLSGNGSERTVAVKPLPNAYGDVTITLIADDHGSVNNLGTGTFVVHVTPVDDAPTVEAIDNQTIPEDTATGQIPVSIADIDDATSTLTLSAVSGNSALIDASGIAFGTNPTTGERWMTLTPKANANGVALITVKVADTSGRFTQKSFTFTVTPVNDPPTITAIADQTILEDKATNTLIFTVADFDDDVLNLTVTGAFGDTTVIPNANIVISGNGAERTVKVTPAADQNGDIPVTLTVTDPGKLTATSTFTVHITPVNDKPTFTVGADQTVREDCGTQTVAAWAANISRGKANEAAQGLSFILSNDNPALFTTAGQPAVDANGQLTYTPAENMNGTTTVTLYAKDDAGTANGGADTSATYTFTITVLPVNDQPTFSDNGNVTVAEDSLAYSAAWAKTASIYVGPSNETQTHTFVLQSTTITSLAGNTNLFSVAPAINAQTGALTFTPAANANGAAELTVVLKDPDGTANGGLDTSAVHTFTITVTPVNDNPTFTLPANVTVYEDSVAYNQTVATGITAGGGTDETSQTLTFTLSGYNAALFETVPSMNSAGVLTFKPAADMNGTTTVTVALSDGTNTVTKTFQIIITAINDRPSFTMGANQQVLEDCKAQTVAGWATNMVKGPADESTQTLSFTVTNNKNALFATQPAISSAGQLTYTPADNAFGVATVTVTLKDNGGTANGGINSTVAQTFTITVLPVNDQPTFSDNGNVTVTEDSGAYSAAWAKSATIYVGPSNETQTHTFVLQSTTIQSVAGNTDLFSVAPAISAQTGVLTFTPAPNANGVAQVTVVLTDPDGTANGGIDTSIVHTFTITVSAVNDLPTFTLGSPISVLEDSDAYDATYAIGITPGGGTDEAGQTLTFTLSGYDATLFATAPAMTSAGRLTFKPAANAFGVTTVTTALSDGTNTVTKTFQITIVPVNDQPTFSDNGNITVAEDSGAYSASWAKAISVGPANETQTRNFVLQSTTVTSVAGNTGLFAVAPAINATTGVVTFTPMANANGVAELSVVLKDADGTTNGGVDTSVVHTFTITVTPVNDDPTFTVPATVTVNEDSGAYSQTVATGITSGGGTDETSQTLTFTLSGYTASLFAVEPTMTSAGLLTFTPAANMNGSTTVTIALSDGTNTVTKTFQIVVQAVNDQPTFTMGADQQVLEDSGMHTVAAWAKDLSKGPANESTQTLSFTVSNNNNVLFSAQPAIDANGQLTYTSAANAFGTATVSVALKDNGGTANSGVDTSATRTFTITVLPVNDQPAFEDNGNVTVTEDSAAYSAAWAKLASITVGPANETQTHTFVLQNTTIQSVAGNTNLFSVAPAIDAQTGVLTFTPAPNANGVAQLTVVLKDPDGTDNGGVDTSVEHTFTITVTAVNDVPTFTLGGKVTVNEDSGAYDKAYVTGITAGGGADENSQTLTFTLTGYDETLFKVKPTISADGQLRFTPAPNMNGVADVTVTMSDGTNDVVKSFQIAILPVNDQPTFTDSGNITVNEDSGVYNAAWAQAASIAVGPTNETQTHTFVLQSTTIQSVAGNASLFSVAPAIDAATGAISFTPAANANGVAELSVVLKDPDGTANGGVDTSEVHTFTITVRAVNDRPTFEDNGNISVSEDSGAYDAAWVKTGSIYVGPADEQQTHTFLITNTKINSFAGNSSLFKVAPAIDAQTGAISFTPAANANGEAEVTVVLKDDDGTAYGGLDMSVTHTFTITVGAANDDPTFTLGGTVTVKEDSGAYSKIYATDITPGGGTDETSQPLTFTLTGYTASLFAVEPTLTSAGRLSFTPADDQYGTTDVTVSLSDGTNTVTKTFQIEILPVNDQPTFTKGDNQQVLEDAGAQTVANWATGMKRGPANESTQTLSFVVSNNNTALFTTVGQPTIDASGKLTYTPAANAYGVATVTVALADNGGTENGGVDTSDRETFTITVLPVNDQPAFTDLGNITVDEDSGAYDAMWATPISIYLGPDNEQQTHTFSIGSTTVNSLAGNTSLFSVAPAIDPNTGAISFTPAKNANGTATVTVTLKDDDGTANGGMDTSEVHTFTITVNAVNDDPTFETAGTVTVKEDSGAYSAAYATGITPGGGTDEAGQTLTFTLSGYNAALFATVPTMAGDGTLSFTPAANAYGDTEVTASLSDGENNVAKTFTISILPVNDQPSFTDSGDITVDEDSGAYSALWANLTSLYVGPINENQSHTFMLLSTTVTSLAGNTSLFSVAPAVDPVLGTISFTPAPNANGTAEVTVVLTDSDGTANGGLDTSVEHTFTITVKAVNDAPTFVTGGPVTVNEDSGVYDQPYATGITTGGGTDESGQTLTFTLSGYNASLFTIAPTITSAGRLMFQPAPDANGTTTVTASLSDGTNTVTNTFQITVRPVNDPPTFTPGGNQQVLQNSKAQTVPGWATNLYRGPGNESGQTFAFVVSNSNNALFTAAGQPAVSTNGQLTYTPADNAYGTATVSVMLTDNGGTDNGGDNTSAAYTFTITVMPASDQMMTTLSVTATWTDHEDKDGMRPATVTVYLYSDAGVIRKQVLDASNNWTYTFADLPVFNQNGVPIAYRVAEAAIAGYHVVYTYGTDAVTINNIHTIDPFTTMKTIPLINLSDYNVPMGANSNMNEGECFN